ncbi:MAG: hypothetical protein VB046_06810 [Paludibacter sp.]|nr:hypothetical protein [Paludibacter sp.]
MGILDTRDVAQEENKYAFASGGIDDFLDDFKRPKQDQPIDEAEGLEEVESFEQQETEKAEPLESLRAKVSVANATGSLLAIAVDAGLSTVLGAVIAKGDPEDYKASESEKEELQDAISEYVKLKGGDIPPGVALIIIILSIYGPKTAIAFQARKFNEKEADYQKQISDLKNQLDKKETPSEG